MKKRIIGSISILSILSLLFSPGLSAGVQAAPAVRYVSLDGTCAGNTPCTTSVQAAVDAALAGDEIRLAEGTYTDMHDCPRNDVVTTGVAPAVVCLSKTLTIRGGYNSTFTSRDAETYHTYLKAEGAGRVLYITGEISPTVEGLVINGGNAAGLGGNETHPADDVGGGVYIRTANVTLRENWITKNTAAQGGGGVYLGRSDSYLESNFIEANSGTLYGDGAGVQIYSGAPVLIGNIISQNVSDDVGGGVFLYRSDATLNANLIRENSAAISGGGVEAATCSPTLTGNIVAANTAEQGGGVLLWYSHSQLTNNVIIDNVATEGGQGSGLWIGGSTPALQHTTLARNTGGDGSAVYIANAQTTASTVSMTNSILAGQGMAVNVNAGNQLNLDAVLWFNNAINTGGAGSINVTHAYTGDPAFDADGYHLKADSAAVGRGVGSSILTDIDAQIRYGLPDLGADEYLATGTQYLFLPLVVR